MSGVIGVFRRDRAPVAPRALDAMIAAAPHRGPDGAATWIDGSIGLGHQLLRTTPEAALERQPFVEADLAVSFDGRLDNRTDLIATLDAAPLRSAPDAAIVAAAYRRWNDACAVRLLGDFALLVWDRRLRRLYGARDALGIKPFVYASTNDAFVCAPEIGQVLAALGRTPRPNEGMVAEYLADRIRTQSETLYEGVLKLPPAHEILVTEESVAVRRYWSADPGRELAYRSDEDYAEHLRDLFTEAVRCRLRADGPIGAHLSGGLDSSSVVGTTQALGARVETFSMMCRGIEGADECEYIDAVIDRWRLPAHRVAPRRATPQRASAMVASRRDALGYPADLTADSLAIPMRERGIRVALTGRGGDHLFEGTYYHYAELMRRLDVAGLVRQIRADRALPASDWSAAILFWSGIRPLIPASVRELARPLARGIGWVDRPPDWIEPDFARQSGLVERTRIRVPLPASGAYGRQHLFTVFAAGETYFVNEQGEQFAAEHGLEERHPFFDRRIVEFALALPERQRWRDGWSKYVLRNAMRDRLPDLVRRRQFKADFSSMAFDVIDAVADGLVDRLRIAEAGWVRQDRITAMHRDMRRLFAMKDPAFGDCMFAVWMALSVELWYRTMYSGVAAPGGDLADQREAYMDQVKNPDDRDTTATAPQRKPYRAPALVEYGSLAALTQGSITRASDGAMAGKRKA